MLSKLEKTDDHGVCHPLSLDDFGNLFSEFLHVQCIQDLDENLSHDDVEIIIFHPPVESYDAEPLPEVTNLEETLYLN